MVHKQVLRSRPIDVDVTSPAPDLPKFSELLQVVASPAAAPSRAEWWTVGHPSGDSTAETDADDEQAEDREFRAERVDFDPQTASSSSAAGGNGKTCRFKDCSNLARSRGLCPGHGGGTRCRAQDCTKHVVSGGLCVAHGGGRRCRAASGCASSAVSRGFCVQHGGGRKCRQTGCTKHVASGGLCRAHGGGRRCQVPECSSSAQSRGLCYVHGGGGRCQRPGCGSSAKKGGLCIAHGGGHRCQVAGCTSSAVSGARCRAHGGGRRCAVEGCTSSAKTGGRCIAHGGGKRCTVSGCTSSAQRLGLCKAHGGGRRCAVEGCTNSAVSRGRCIAHGGGKRCVFEGCSTTARKGGYCFAHGGRSTTSLEIVSVDNVVHESSPASSIEPTPLTPATAPVKPMAWPSSSPASVVSLIPSFTLPRTRLPPLNTLLTALQTKYQGAVRPHLQIPPMREFTAGSLHGLNGGSNVPGWGRAIGALDEAARRLDAEDTSGWKRAGGMATPTLTSTPKKAAKPTGYSWTSLQETIRRESRAQGLTNDEDEHEHDSSDAYTTLDDSKLREKDLAPASDGHFYWTRNRGGIPT